MTATAGNYVLEKTHAEKIDSYSSERNIVEIHIFFWKLISIACFREKIRYEYFVEFLFLLFPFKMVHSIFEPWKLFSNEKNLKKLKITSILLGLTLYSYVYLYICIRERVSWDNVGR